MIGVVIHFEDDVVIAFDKHGNRIPRYCGSYKDVREQILKVVPDDAVFAYAYYDSRGMQKVSKQEW